MKETLSRLGAVTPLRQSANADNIASFLTVAINQSFPTHRIHFKIYPYWRGTFLFVKHDSIVISGPFMRRVDLFWLRGMSICGLCVIVCSHYIGAP